MERALKADKVLPRVTLFLGTFIPAITWHGTIDHAEQHEVYTM